MNMEPLTEKKSAREILLPFDKMRTHFCGIGFRVALQLAGLQNELMMITMKHNSKTLDQKDLDQMDADIRQLLTNLQQVGDMFPGFIKQVKEVAADAKRRFFARALGRLSNVITPSQSVPPLVMRAPLTEWLEEPPVLGI